MKAVLAAATMAAAARALADLTSPDKNLGQIPEIGSSREDSSEFRDEIPVEVSVQNSSDSMECVPYTEEPVHHSFTDEDCTRRQSRRKAAVAALAAIHQSKEAKLGDSSESEVADSSDDYQTKSDDSTSEEEEDSSGIPNAAQHHSASSSMCGIPFSRAAQKNDYKMYPVLQQNTNISSPLKCNNSVLETLSQRGIDKLDSGKIAIHPTSGLLVLQIDANEKNSYHDVVYKCLKCNEIYSSDMYCETHGAPKNGKQTFSCHLCGKKLLHHYDLSDHLHCHGRKRNIVCVICNRLMSTKRALRRHMNTVHSTNKPFACQICSKTFSVGSLLRSHMAVHSNVRCFECKICGKLFKLNSALRRHERCHPDHSKDITITCHVCGKTMNKDSLRRHLQQHTSAPVKCKICDKTYVSEVGLRQHLRIHYSDKSIRHICEVCGKVLKSPSMLKDHMNIHSGLQPYICAVCGKKFATKIKLSRHSKLHSEKNLKCDTCGYISNRWDNLVTHLRSHTGEKPYSCSICGKNCSRRDNFLTHMRRVHGVDYIPK